MRSGISERHRRFTNDRGEKVVRQHRRRVYLLGKQMNDALRVFWMVRRTERCRDGSREPSSRARTVERDRCSRRRRSSRPRSNGPGRSRFSRSSRSASNVCSRGDAGAHRVRGAEQRDPVAARGRFLRVLLVVHAPTVGPQHHALEAAFAEGMSSYGRTLPVRRARPLSRSVPLQSGGRFGVERPELAVEPVQRHQVLVVAALERAASA